MPLRLRFLTLILVVVILGETRDPWRRQEAVHGPGVCRGGGRLLQGRGVGEGRRRQVPDLPQEGRRRGGQQVRPARSPQGPGSGTEQAMRHNRDAFARMARLKEKDQSRLLLKVVGELDHGGKDVLKPDSAGYRILATFVRRVNAPRADVGRDRPESAAVLRRRRDARRPPAAAPRHAVARRPAADRRRTRRRRQGRAEGAARHPRRA